MITITFGCGHSKTANGSEQSLQCACGETRVAALAAPLPRFIGCVTGPHAEFKDLPAKPVTFGESTSQDVPPHNSGESHA